MRGSRDELSDRAPGGVSLWRLFMLHPRVGNLTFGGGDPTLAARHSEVVAARGWIGGVLAAAAGMVAAAAWQLAMPYLDRKRGVHAAAITGGAIALSLGLSISPIPVTAPASVAGSVWRIPE